ncbi:hypothetical protein F5148DRAFT_1150588 [Russula earlei]|uniref:Uncharacterized protein n=1 Tax=Russula earlei TaxID=71964 RepID=A0ACC0U602_9AGAM|nr:hypothetical protein F5148DRAFT_1150588 [Russula earlei]
MATYSSSLPDSVGPHLPLPTPRRFFEPLKARSVSPLPSPPPTSLLITSRPAYGNPSGFGSGENGFSLKPDHELSLADGDLPTIALRLGFGERLPGSTTDRA